MTSFSNIDKIKIIKIFKLIYCSLQKISVENCCFTTRYLSIKKIAGRVMNEMQFAIVYYKDSAESKSDDKIEVRSRLFTRY